MNVMKKQAVHWRRTMERWLRVEGSGYVLSVVGSVILLSSRARQSPSRPAGEPQATVTGRRDEGLLFWYLRHERLNRRERIAFRTIIYSRAPTIVDSPRSLWAMTTFEIPSMIL